MSTVALAVCALTVTILTTRFLPGRLHGLLADTPIAPTLSALLVRAAVIGIWIMGLSYVAQLAGYQGVPFLTVGTVALVIGLSVQNVAQNALDGAFLGVEGAVGIGDTVTVGSKTGMIVDVTIRCFVLDTGPTTVLVPNSVMFTEILERVKET